MLAAALLLTVGLTYYAARTAAVEDGARFAGTVGSLKHVPVIFIVGVVVSLILFSILWLQAKGRAELKRSAYAVRQSAAALLETESRYRELIEHSQDLLCTYDLNGQVLSASPGAAKLLGYEQDALLGTNIRDILAPEAQDQFTHYMAELKAHGSVKGLMQVQTRSGETRIWSYQSIFLTEGVEIPIIRGMARDITERKRAEAALRESEERYRRLVELAPEAIFVYSEGKIVFVNSAGAKLLGAAHPTELIGRSLLDSIPPEGRGKVESYFRQTVAEGTVFDVLEEVFVRLDGSFVEVEVSAMPLLYQGQKAIQAFVRNVTERKQAEEMLRAADHRAVEEYERLLARLASLALCFGTARDLVTIYRGLRDFSLSLTPSFALVICSYDEAREVREGVYLYFNGAELDDSTVGPMPVRSGPAGRAIKTGTVVISNDYVKEISGRSPVLIGFDEDSSPPQSALIAPMIIMGRTIGTIEVQSHELAAYTREHATAMQMAANLAANALENVRLLDLEREKEEQLRQSQKMEAIGKLAGGVAHDFNNLLTAITGYSDLSLRHLDKTDRLYRNLQEIKKAGERAAGLTRQLLAFSRKQVLQPKVLDLNAVIVDLNKMLQRLIGEDIDMMLMLKPDLGKVKADPGQIEQILMNLLVNARDAMPVGGKLTIETANLYVNEQSAHGHPSVPQGCYVVLSVSDTGCGMDIATQERIFEPFFTTKEVGKGTGLGLSTVYGVVQQSGGDVWVESEVGKGTTFKVYLPREDELAESVEVETETVIPAGTETVLLVEDETIVRKMTKEILQLSGYQVLEASNGQEALMVCEQHHDPVHLMLTDVVMPLMSGRELAEHLAQRRPEIKVLYMSGYTDDAIVHHGVLEKGTAFLEKPFTPNGLSRKVREVLDGSKGA